MKVLHTADWHIGQFKGPVVDGVNLRSQDTVNCLNYMIKVAEEEKPDIVCVSGDVFHQEPDRSGKILRRNDCCNRHDHKTGRCCESSDCNERNTEP